MNKDEIKGRAKDVKGHAKETLGKLTDDERLEGEGVADQAEGHVQETFGRGKRKVGEAIEDLGDRIKH